MQPDGRDAETDILKLNKMICMLNAST